MVRRSGSGSAPARPAPRHLPRRARGRAGRGRSPRAEESSASTRAAPAHFARASRALPKISSGPLRRSTDSPSSPQNSRSARARSGPGAAAATLRAPSARRSCTRPSWHRLLAAHGRQAVGLDPVEHQARPGHGHAAVAALQRGDRLVLDHLDAQVVREVGAHAQARHRRERLDRLVERAAVDVQRAHAARRRLERGAHLGVLRAGAAGHAHRLDRRERRVAEPQPAQREADDREHADPASTRQGSRFTRTIAGHVRRRTGGSYPASARPSASTSPAPSVSTRSPSRSRSRR